MLLKKINTLLQKSSQVKTCNLFSITPSPDFLPTLTSCQERLEKWLLLCKKENLPLQKGISIDQENLSLIFQNGLIMVDNGHRISFSTLKKEKNPSVTPIILQHIAKFICRNRWRVGINFSNVTNDTFDIAKNFNETYNKERQKIIKKRTIFFRKEKRR